MVLADWPSEVRLLSMVDETSLLCKFTIGGWKVSYLHDVYFLYWFPSWAADKSVQLINQSKDQSLKITVWRSD